MIPRIAANITDIDTDVITEERPRIFQYITERFGKAHTARVGSYGTLADLAIIDGVCRSLARKWEESHPGLDKAVNPYSLTNVKQIKKLYKEAPETARKRYREVFYYYDGLAGCKISQSVHPAGMVISPIDMAEEYGLMWKDGEQCLILSMDEVHDIGAVKYDFLGLKTLKVIRDACQLAGIPFPRYHEINLHDEKVWEDLARDPISCFQFESDFAATSLQSFRPANLDDLSLITASIRPSGASYRDSVFAHKVHRNPTRQMDELFADTLGNCVYQEQIILALMKLCGFTGGQADTVRRHIAKKNPEAIEKDLIAINDGYCRLSSQPREVAEAEVKDFVQVIQDASGYSFGKNHSYLYCFITYLCAYLRYYYPMAYIASYLNNAKEDADIATGAELARQYHIMIHPPRFGFSRDEYACDASTKSITKGIASIKNFGADIGNALYDLAHSQHFTCFADVLMAMKGKMNMPNSKQLRILIGVDFFSEFGNQRELERVVAVYDLLKSGDAKRLSREAVDGHYLEPIVKRHATWFKKNGEEATFYTIQDAGAILREAEQYILSMHIEDYNLYARCLNWADAMGYWGYVTGKEEDRSTLFVKTIIPVCRKSDGKQFGYSVFTKSIGSGIETRFTVFNEVFSVEPLMEGDIIVCYGYTRNGKYFTMTSYRKVQIDQEREEAIV